MNKQRQFCTFNILLWTGIAVLGMTLATPAQAQFVCGGSTDGSTGLAAQGASATGGSNVACGTNANAVGNGSTNTATGTGANASGGNSVNTAIGSLADAHGFSSHNVATGDRANASGNTAVNVATGSQANASGDGSENVATGFLANASGGTGSNPSVNTAIGAQSDASGTTSENTSTGFAAKSSGDFSKNVATGNRADAHGNNSSNVAAGSQANASGDGSKNTAVGANSVATGNNSSAFGAGAQAPFVNSAAFGVGAVATRANQQVFGTATNTYTLPGVTSAASTSAQSGPTQVVTTDSSGNLAAVPISSLVQGFDPTAINLHLNQLDRRVDKAFTGTAMAFAMSASPTLLPGKKVALSANWGTFQGENGAALTGALRIYREMQLNAAFAYGFRENMGGGRVGMSYQW